MNNNITNAEIKGRLKSNGNQLAVVSKSTAYTAQLTDEVILCNGSSAGFIITLPTAIGVPGQTYTIKKTDNTNNNITITTTDSQTIDGSTNYILSSQFKYLRVISDGEKWNIIGSN